MELLLDPWAWLAVILFSILGAVGNLVNYQIGKRGVDAVLSRFPQITPERWERVGGLYKAHGPKILFLSALPVLHQVVHLPVHPREVIISMCRLFEERIYDGKSLM